MAMIPSLLLSFLSLLLVILITSEAADQLDFLYHECNNQLGNFTPGSDYEKNRREAISFGKKEIDYGFYNLSVGQNPDIVYAVGLCRGDVNRNDCHNCLVRSQTLLPERCKTQKEAIGWFDECMLGYSNRSTFGVMETYPSKVHCSLTNVTEVDQFNQRLDDLLDRLRSDASGDPSRRKFAEANATVQSSKDTIYALLQCTPDLSKQDCTECLNSGIEEIPNFCYGKAGGRYSAPSCSVRYETTVFFGPVADAPQPEASPPQAASPPPASVNATSGKGKSNKSRTVVAIIVPVVTFVVLLILIYIYSRVRKPRKSIESDAEDEANTGNEIKTTDELLQFDFETIRFATNDFSDANKLGQGGFGTVYKGKLSNGQEVAIKRLSENSGQGETEFKNEVLLTAKLQHRNLVRLFGFCLKRRERLLIYEFVPNKSLDYIIFDPSKRALLDWERRYKIIGGIARGLLYLHENSRLQVIHRDLKTSNILLDEELNSKISGFGLARLFIVNQTQGNTSTIIGTSGYMAPEYVKHGHFSIKSDVFSFGVIILEIVCGRKNTEIHKGENVEDLLSFAWRNWRGGTTSNIIDPTLNHDSMNEIKRCIHIGLLCVQEDMADRPTMAYVLLMLSSHSFPLPEPSEPAFFMRSKSLMAIPSSEHYSEATRSSDSGSQSVQGSTSKAPITDLFPR